MESNIKVNFKYSGISNAEILKYAEKEKKIHNILNQNIEKKQNFTGWITWPCSYDKKEFEKIKKIANKVKKDSQVLIVIGIGGSYLGARAVIESLTNKFKRDDSVEILYVGNNLNANYINEIIDYVSDKDISINIISKSGKTTEPAIANAPVRTGGGRHRRPGAAGLRGRKGFADFRNAGGGGDHPHAGGMK